MTSLLPGRAPQTPHRSACSFCSTKYLTIISHNLLMYDIKLNPKLGLFQVYFTQYSRMQYAHIIHSYTQGKYMQLEK